MNANNEVLDLCRKLGEALRQSPEFTRYNEARAVCRADKELQSKIDEFKVQKKIYDTESAKPDADPELVAVIKGRLDELYDEVYSKDIMTEFSSAEDDFNLLLNAVNMTITSYISEQPYSAEGSCTHNCSTCGGCH